MKLFQLKSLYVAILLGAGLVASAQTKELTTDSFKGGKIHLINSSHQDIAWVDEIDVCRHNRAERIMMPVLKRMAENPDFCYSVESAMYLDEFLEQHPEKYDEVLKYTREGRLEWGAVYTQPYHGMYDSEALVRMVYFGKRHLMKRLPGTDYRAAWSVDVPGITLQWPQILAKAGVDYFNISRYQTGYYNWKSPDGSKLLIGSTGQYSGYSGQILALPTDEEKVNQFIHIVNWWGDYHRDRHIAPACLAMLSQDCTEPVDYDDLIENWNSHVIKDQKKYRALPAMQYSTSTMFFDHLTSNPKSNFETVYGERPDMWLYIHGPGHHTTLQAAREASRKLNAAEKFSTLYSWATNDWSVYPYEKLNQAWKQSICADHGWGGNKGHLIDAYFKENFEQAREAGYELLADATHHIADLIQYDKSKPYAVTVFNSQSFERTDPVTFNIDMTLRAHPHVKVVDESGKDVPFQFVENKNVRTMKDNSLTILFVAEKVPAMGYKTYYVVEDNQFQLSPKTYKSNEFENDYYKLQLGQGGIESLFDKELNKEVFDVTRFKGAELFTLKSEGTGAGEFAEIQQPTLDGFDKLSNYQTNWNCVESGDVRNIYETKAQLKDVSATLRVVMYKHIKKVDVEVDLNGYIGENWREYRLAFPVAKEYSQVAYDVPMGVLKVGEDDIFSQTHPREVQDWFTAYGENSGLTIGSDVAVFDWMDPTDLKGNHVLQPILLASRKSCHGAGNYYLQSGNHSYKFSLMSHDGNWKNGYQSGVQHNNPLEVVVRTAQEMKEGTLPTAMSFVTIDAENVLITAVKRAEDDHNVVVRYYDLSGQTQEVKMDFFKEIEAVQHTDIIENNGQMLPSRKKGFDFSLGKYSIETFKVEPEL